MLLRSGLLLLCVLVSTGCGQSKDDLQRYASSLERLPGVEEISVGVSTPLPFTVQGTLTVQLEPDVTRAQFDAFAKQACSDDVNASVSFAFAIDLSETTVLRQRRPELCAKAPGLLIELAPALRGHVDGIQAVEWRDVPKRDDGKRSAKLEIFRDVAEGAASPPDLTRSIDVAGVALDTLDDPSPTFELRAPAMTIAPTSVGRAREVLDATSALIDEGFLVIKVDAQEERVLYQLEGGDIEEAEDLVRTTSPDLQAVRVIDDSVELHGVGVAEDSIDLADALQEADPSWDVSATSIGVRAVVETSADVLRVHAAARAAKLADTKVTYSVGPTPTGPTASITPTTVALTEGQLSARVAVLDDLIPGLHIKTLRFERGGVQAWLDEEHYGDESSIDAARSALRASIRKHGLEPGLRFVTLNNRDVK